MTTLTVDGYHGDQRSHLIYDLRSTLQRVERLLDQLAAADLVPELNSIEHLSDRERDVLRLLARGRSNKEIAHELTIADNTVKTHVSTILGKLGVQSRTQAALFAERVGLVVP